MLVFSPMLAYAEPVPMTACLLLGVGAGMVAWVAWRRWTDRHDNFSRRDPWGLP